MPRSPRFFGNPCFGFDNYFRVPDDTSYFYLIRTLRSICSNAGAICPKSPSGEMKTSDEDPIPGPQISKRLFQKRAAIKSNYGSLGTWESVPLFDNQGRALDYNECSRVSVNRWLKLVGVLLIVAVVVAVASPDFYLQPTITRISRATQRPHVVVFAAIAVTNKLWVQHFTPSPLAVFFRGSGDYPPDLIDLNCTRLC
jgi:hypothetical protein